MNKEEQLTKIDGSTPNDFGIEVEANMPDDEIEVPTVETERSSNIIIKIIGNRNIVINGYIIDNKDFNEYLKNFGNGIRYDPPKDNYKSRFVLNYSQKILDDLVNYIKSYEGPMKINVITKTEDLRSPRSDSFRGRGRGRGRGFISESRRPERPESIRGTIPKQVIHFEIDKPYKGMKCKILSDNEFAREVNDEVDRVNGMGDNIEEVYLRNYPVKLVIINREWKVLGSKDNHRVIFSS